MSLINDALKRAKAAQQQAPLPTPDLPFRPVEPAQQRARRGLGLAVPIMLTLVACLLLFFLWQWAQTPENEASIDVAARTAASEPLDPAQTETAAPVTTAPPEPAAQPASPPTPAVTAAGVAATNAPAATANAKVADAKQSAATNAAPVVEPAQPKPAPLRLQGIVYQPGHSSAMISGKTVYTGDKIRDFRVVAIDQESVTLVGAGQTNVLSLSE